MIIDKLKLGTMAAVLGFTLTGALCAAEKAPAWVSDYNAVYPDALWVCVVESARNKDAASANAHNSIAKTFKVDVKGVSNAMQSMSQTVQGGKASILKNSAISRQVEASTDVSGLMGVISDSWTAADGTVYVCSRMNRRDGAVLYTSIISENDKVIRDFTKDSESHIGSFEAYQSLQIAANLAVITDNYLNILSVLNPASRDALSVSYGNAPSVKKRADESIRAVVIAIKVEGDTTGRIKKAFQTVFTKHGFRTQDAATNANGTGAYLFSVEFTLSEAVYNDDRKYARYELNAALADSAGNELLAYSDNQREGHATYAEAEKRALRVAESSISNHEYENSFVNIFNEFLVSLTNDNK
jgi:hypothetical protein